MCEPYPKRSKELIIVYLQVRGAVLALQLARSKLLKTWKEMDARVTHNLAEAKDNVKFVYAIEEYCHPLYLNDPVSDDSS